MKNSPVAFKLCEKWEKSPVGHTETLIFYFKIDTTGKERYVAGGHITDVPTYMTYYSVVRRGTVSIEFLIAALNNLDV